MPWTMLHHGDHTAAEETTCAGRNQQSVMAAGALRPRQLPKKKKKKMAVCIVLFGITPTGNSGCLPRGKPAVTELHYPAFGAGWVF